jgi:hypothetical protein
MGSDIVDRGFEGHVADFFDLHALLGSSVITNPPFVFAQRFVEHALNLGARKIAIIQRLAFLEGQERGKMFRATPPARVWVFSSRQSMPPGGMDVPATGGAIAYCWIVWERGHFGPPALGWLP